MIDYNVNGTAILLRTPHSTHCSQLILFVAESTMGVELKILYCNS